MTQAPPKAPAQQCDRGFVFVSSMTEHHHLYNRASWRKLRLLQLHEHPLCRMHEQLGQMVVASVVDHITAHHGDMDKFLDIANLQSLCKPCHDGHKQAQEHNADGILRGAGLDGRPLDLAHSWHRAHFTGATTITAATIPTGRWGRGVQISTAHVPKTGP